MLVSSGPEERTLAPGELLVFGRGVDVDIAVTTADDAGVSRRAGELSWDRYAWRVRNIGRRAFFVVEAGYEIELLPEAHERSAHQLLHDDAWIRVPIEDGDVAVVLQIPESERPEPASLLATDTPEGTIIETGVTLTDNELRSVVAVYEGFLALPPFYRREPNSYRAAAHRIGAEEGKVKADLRRVQDKVARAGGPTEGGSRVRDTLIGYLASRGVVRREHLDLLD